MVKKSMAIALCLLASTSMALAEGATLQDKVGTVLVNNGSGFAPAAEGAVLLPTDIITLRRQSTAFLVYADGCRTKLVPGRTVTVDSTQCAQHRELADLPERAAPPAFVPPPPPAFGLGPGAILGGVVIAGAGIGAAVALSSRNDPVFFNSPTRRRVSP